MKIENSHNIIRIRFDGFLSCLFINKPRSVDWPDHEGTVARYYACLPLSEYDKEIQSNIEKRVSSIQSIEELQNSGFLELLEQGEYEFELWKDKPTTLLYNTILLNSNETLHLWRKNQIGNSRSAKPYFLDKFYPYGRQLMFTQPFETLNQRRIKDYEKRIQAGERPLALAIRVKRGDQDDEDSYQDNYFNTTKYILDGHHKLVAYQNLKINPSYIVINRKQRGDLNEHDESCLPMLYPYLFHYQIEDIITSGIGSMKQTKELGEYIDKFILNTSVIDDTLVKTIYRNATYPALLEDESKQKWYAMRLSKLKSKIDTQKSRLHLNYFCSKDFRTKSENVNSWAEVKVILKEQL